MSTRKTHLISPRPAGAVIPHMPAIDGLRGIAILLVLVHHFTPAVSGNAFTQRMLGMAHTGWIGVDLFFVLSGFLITAILLKTKHGPDYFLNFFARRTLRIFPIYYVVLTVLLLALPVMAGTPIIAKVVNTFFGNTVKDLPSMLEGQSWLWLYGGNIKIALTGERWGAVNHFWSLAVEEHFYLIWPVVVFFCSRQGLVKVCGLCILGAPVLRAMLMLAGFDSVVPYVLTPCRVDSLAIGALTAVLITQPAGLKTWLPRSAWMAGLAAVVLGATIVSMGRLHRDDLLTTTLGYSMLAIISAFLVLAAASVKSGTLACRIVANPVLSSLGKYSYGIYVTHMFFNELFIKFFPWTGLHQLLGSYPRAIVAHAVLSIGCSWLIAYVCFHAFEKHFLKLKALFDYRRPTPQPATVPVSRPALGLPVRAYRQAA
ncbi:MAG TPA: acyltransferase [Tepidisphaeraceae bacterium]|jgi:peptidoglycan/LPS O-acetylase OafA/YrhL